ncbi:MAG: glycoside hydrolase family 9 protein, partial [Bacteroidota bacterium]
MISPRFLLIALVLGLVPAVGSAQHHASGTVHLNQNATYPDAPKVAVVVGAKGGEAAQVVSDLDGRLVWEGTVGEPADYHWSGESVGIVRFDDIQEVGMYRVHVEGLGTSEVMEVRPNAFEEATRLSLRALYLQRASVALPVEFAGVWQRDAGHPDDQVIIHPSAASEGRPAGSTISAPGGWYDAGDYNKYVVPAAVTSYYLFGALESFPSAVSELDLGIPESANGAPDIVDEAVWNLRWMMRMQDPADGGLYHKLTHASFQGWLMPKDVTAPRYVVQKTTNAALTYAAALAQAARFLPAYPEYQSLADSCLAAARRAWAWAEANPAVTYDQNAMNAQHDPDISTGPYADGEYDDERAWAGVELALATGDATFLDSIDFTRVFDAPVPYWEIDTGQLALRSLYEGTGPIA